jgi:hypothetical protein
MGGHHAAVGASDEWYTPPAVFAALGLTFDLDPCAPPLPTADWIPTARRYSLTAHALCFLAGRLTFVPADATSVAEGRTNGNAGAPSLLLAVGEECAAAVAASGLGMTFAVRSRPALGQASLWEAAA